MQKIGHLCVESGILTYVLAVVLMHPGVNLTTQRDVWPRDLASIVIRVNDILLRSTEDRSYSFAVYIHDASDSSGTPLFMGGIEVQGKATGDDDGGDEESKPRFLPQVEIDELAMGDRLYLQGDVQAANRIWTVTVVALPGTFEPDVLVVAVGGSIIFIATLLVAVWVFINTRKIETANRRAERLLLNVLPEEMAERLKTNPSHVADHFDSATVLYVISRLCCFTCSTDFSLLSRPITGLPILLALPK